MAGFRRRLAPAAAIACVALLLCAAWAWQQARADAQRRQHGAALFHGDVSLVARLHGHSQTLPAAAARCSNCHQAISSNPAPLAASGLLRPYAGVIQGMALTTLRARRGGPPSAYDESRLCDVLRTGVDPAHVMISDTMPRYQPSPADCAALWAFLRHEPA